MTIQDPDTFQAHPKVPKELKAGHVFVTLEEEFDNFDTETKVYQKSPDLESDFVPYRLRMGTYGQRQENMQMMRIKLPYGGVNAEQMDALAEVAEKHSGMRRGHITTRENIQFHFVPLDQASTVMRILAEAGLSTREACGHTVRNVTGCPYAGVTDHQLFDVTPYLAAHARNMIRNPICQNMPRKWKTSFSCVPIDCAGSPFHDMGFVAALREENGEQVRGFKIVVGGGTSTMVRAAETLWEFARADDGQYIRVAEAAKVIENTQRDLNIALVNELAILFEELDIDTHEVLRAAASKWNFLPFTPGLVGGHCIGVDPYYLTFKAQQVGHHPEVILAGRRINDAMGFHVANRVIRLMLSKRIHIIDSRVLILGMTFKENCPDTRNSRVRDIVSTLQSYHAQVDVYDPWVDAGESELLIAEPEADRYDAVIIAVAHEQFIAMGIETLKAFGKSTSVIFDVTHLFPSSTVDGSL